MSDVTRKLYFRFRRWIEPEDDKKRPEDIVTLFKKYCEGDERKRMSIVQFRKFLEEHQGESQGNAKQFAEKVFSKYKKHRKGLRLQDFFHALLEDMNHPLNFQESEDNMRAPLSHYFWHTGYDSYLYFKWHESIKAPKNRKSSDRHEEGTSHYSFGGRTILDSIKKALKSGVKVIELDVKLKLNSDKRVVVKYEGMESFVSLRKCLKAITDNAFARSPYPFIVILDYDKAGLEDQVIDVIKKTMGDMWRPDIGLDSLEKQKNKIIILTRDPGTCSNSSETTPSDDKNEKPQECKLILLKEHKDEDPDRSEINLNITDFDVKFTQGNLIGVYLNPKGTGISSSDYNPLIGWSKGAQMVACNMKPKSIQEPERLIEKYIEKYVWIMQAMFRATGDTGFAKKPDILLRQDPVFDPNKWRPVQKILKVKVYMGTGWHLQFDNQDFDPTSPPDFFASIEIVGVPSDEAREKTLPAMDKWIPQWEQEFTFPLTVPELAFVMIKVSDFDPDRSHDFGGQTCLPVSLLKTRGIRSVTLFKFRGWPHHPPIKLLVRFQLDPCYP